MYHLENRSSLLCFSGFFTGVCLTMDLPVDPFLCYSNLLTLAMPDATGFNPGGLTFSADCRVAVITIPGVRICKSRRLETRRVLSQVLFFFTLLTLLMTAATTKTRSPQPSSYHYHHFHSSIALIASNDNDRAITLF